MEKLEKIFNEETKILLISYFGNKKVKDISNILNISSRSITQFYKNRNMKLNKNQKNNILKQRKTKYNCNHNFFNEKSIESIYWAGFIAADGCIYNNRLQIKLKSTDKDHLKVLKDSIHYNGVLYNSQGYRNDTLTESIALYITSEKIINDLKLLYNINSKKSLTYSFPLLNEDEIDYFILGYFDGDGTIYNKKNYKCIRFYGTQSVCKHIKNRVDFLYEKNSGSLFKKENIYCFELNPKASNFFISYYSKLNCYKMKRKLIDKGEINIEDN